MLALDAVLAAVIALRERATVDLPRRSAQAENDTPAVSRYGCSGRPLIQ